MILCLDTSAAADLLRGHPAVRERYSRALSRSVSIKVSTVALAELAHGVRASARPEAQMRALERLLMDVDVVPFDDEDALMAGSVLHQLHAPGLPIGTFDTLIAAQAVNRGWTVVTNDVTHFGRVQGLAIIDWRSSDEVLDVRTIVARLSKPNRDK